MNRSHLALAALLGGGVALYAAAAPVPRAELTPADFFPTAVGTKWGYHSKATFGDHVESDEDMVRVITAATEHEGLWHVTVHQSGEGDSSQHSVWSVSPAGLRQRFTPPDSRATKRGPSEFWMTVLPAGIRPGATWSNETHDREQLAWRHTIRGWESVGVPAGVFRALRIDASSDILGRDGKRVATLSLAAWLAPGVGLVKYALHGDRTPVGLPTSDRTWELVSFTPGR